MRRVLPYSPGSAPT